MKKKKTEKKRKTRKKTHLRREVLAPARVLHHPVEPVFERRRLGPVPVLELVDEVLARLVLVDEPLDQLWGHPVEILRVGLLRPERAALVARAPDGQRGVEPLGVLLAGAPRDILAAG